MRTQEFSDGQSEWIEEHCQELIKLAEKERDDKWKTALREHGMSETFISLINKKVINNG